LPERRYHGTPAQRHESMKSRRAQKGLDIGVLRDAGSFRHQRNGRAPFRRASEGAWLERLWLSGCAQLQSPSQKAARLLRGNHDPQPRIILARQIPEGNDVESVGGCDGRLRANNLCSFRSRADHRQQHLESTEGLQSVRLVCWHEDRFACRRP
jgi:hypothetical protein